MFFFMVYGVGWYYNTVRGDERSSLLFSLPSFKKRGGGVNGLRGTLRSWAGIYPFGFKDMILPVKIEFLH